MELRKRIEDLVQSLDYSERCCKKREETAFDSYFRGLDRGYADAYAICKELLENILALTTEEVEI